MKIDFTKVFTDFAGNEIPNGDSGKPIDLKGVCVGALLQQTSEKIGGLAKAKCYDLALKINQAEKPIDLDSEEIVAIKALIDKFQPPMIVGQAFKLLEGKDK